MAPNNMHHRRTHNLLLISKLLNQRDSGSPFTLVLDSLEQSGKPLVGEYIRRAKVSNVQVIFVSLETIKTPHEDITFIPAWDNTLQVWQKQIADSLKVHSAQRKLLVFDSLNSLSSSPSTNTQLPALLSSFISPTTSLLAVYHTDSPVSSRQGDAYSPSPVTLLKYLATTIITTHSFSHVRARKAARERSHVPPSFGLNEGTEGIVQGLGANGRESLVLEMEHRRKSGRGVKEWYFLPYSSDKTANISSKTHREIVSLLEDHPLYRSAPPEDAGDTANGGESETTFELGLTEKQKRDREGVVLPYFDAQNGGVEGGRILYDMGSEDDFDDEEDEI
ncbi:Elongator complex protein 5 [Acrodontium crateriforme]|uniref:Elongator complex protein 5 n=1 Tax=Acrodontium crateriforme TaxID=150365 RepID=A0AAQ3M7S1_9PEZI|nr:Elongator complex protein 5 [Acrodontium crateriforme]